MKTRHLSDTAELYKHWTVDLSVLEKKYSPLLIMDLSTKKIIGVAIQDIETDGSFRLKELIQRLDTAIQERQIPKTLTTDQGGQFVSKEFNQWITIMNILHHRVTSHGNQAQ